MSIIDNLSGEYQIFFKHFEFRWILMFSNFIILNKLLIAKICTSFWLFLLTRLIFIGFSLISSRHLNHSTNLAWFIDISAISSQEFQRKSHSKIQFSWMVKMKRAKQSRSKRTAILTCLQLKSEMKERNSLYATTNYMNISTC